jgi:hypothetical protein
MKWARGLFRLWLVLSVLWIGFVATMTWQTLPTDPNPPLRFVIDKPGDELSWWEKYRSAAADLPDAPRIIDGREQIRSAVFEAFIPPLSMLALGAALIWAMRGFRAR